ncbi:type II toxin-antitoxin system RelE/ParE family toxin [Lactiplantibacillus garii]|nr:type II toxin-antitoxin system YafQ family toxin [Lactiplantibacillus garii]
MVKKKNRSVQKVFDTVHALIIQDKDLLRTKYRDHPLKGKYRDFRELHLESDWLLMCRFTNEHLQLVLVRTGTHDELFN